MDGVVSQISILVKQYLLKDLRRHRDSSLQKRYLTVLNLLNSRSASETAQVLPVCCSTVYRVARSFSYGQVGLLGHRKDNGQSKLDERYLAILYGVVKSTSREHGWRHATWARGMLVETTAVRTLLH